MEILDKVILYLLIASNAFLVYDLVIRKLQCWMDNAKHTTHTVCYDIATNKRGEREDCLASTEPSTKNHAVPPEGPPE